MGYLHPLFLNLTFLAALYVLWTGWLRFQTVFLQKNAAFPWKRHVHFGTVVMFIWLCAPALGLLGAQLVWGSSTLGIPHAYWGLCMLPLVIFGYISGRVMDRVKARRRWLPLAHGLNNAVLVIMALWQGYTGFALVRML